MEKLADFKPIRRLDLSDLQGLNCAGLIVIVGPNSSGKTQLLKDITQRVSGELRDLVVAESIVLNTPDHAALLECLLKEGYIKRSWNDQGQEQFLPVATFVGTGQAAQAVTARQLLQWKSITERETELKRRDEYRHWMGHYLVTSLLLENRLTSLRAVETIDFVNEPPRNDLHALHLNNDARMALTKEIERAFTKAIWSCPAQGKFLCLWIADDSALPSPEDRLKVDKMTSYPTIESEGDGMKSYVATVIAILLGRRPIAVIDEPELCLHPPQAFSLGQFLGSKATSSQTATFVATHSSQVLRGILHTTDDLQIIRLSKNVGGFKARLVEAEVLAKAMRKPTVRAETVLDGIFARAVVVIEGDGDRIVYQAAWEKVVSPSNLDVHFASVGGVGGIADTCQLYFTLGIPVSVIADLDVLSRESAVEQVLNGLGVDEAKRAELINDIKGVTHDIRAIPPVVTESQAQEELTDISQLEFDWSKGDDKKLHERLSKLRNDLDRIQRLKRGGVNALPNELGNRVQKVLDRLASTGLFLVPVGELEGWLQDAKLNASKSKKWAWANEAATYLRDTEPGEGDIWSFVTRVGDYLAQQMR